jgi:hypothetical protein
LERGWRGTFTPAADVAQPPVIKYFVVHPGGDKVPELDGAMPSFFPVVPPAPAPQANPVIPYRIGQWLGDKLPEWEPQPFFFPQVGRKPSFPVPPLNVVPFHFDIANRLQEALPQFIFSTVRKPSFPVPPLNVVPFHFDIQTRLQEALPQFIFSTVRKESHPVPPLQVVPFHFDIQNRLQEALPQFIFSTVRKPSFPVPPLNVVPFHFSVPGLDESVPQYIVFPWESEPPAAPGRNVIHSHVVRFPFTPDIPTPIPDYMPYPWFTTFARPVLPFQVVKFPHSPAELDGAQAQFFDLITQVAAVAAGRNVVHPQVVPFPFTRPETTPEPEYITFPWFTTFARPVPPMQVVPFHFQAPEMDGAQPKFYVLVLPAAAAVANAINVGRMMTQLVEEADPVRLSPDSLPRFISFPGPFPVVWEDYEQWLQYDVPQYTSPTAYFEAILKADTSAIARARLYNITDATAVPGSTLQTASTSEVRLRTSALTLSGTKEYKAQAGHIVGRQSYMGPARLIVDQ